MFNGFDFLGDENFLNEIFGKLPQNPHYQEFFLKDGKVYSREQLKQEQELKQKQEELLKQEKKDKQDSTSVNISSAEQMRKNAKAKRDEAERQKMAETLAFINQQIKYASDRGLTSVDVFRSELTIDLQEIKKGYESLGYKVKENLSETGILVNFDWS